MKSNVPDNLHEICKQWILDSAESDLGLWWLAEDVREILGDDASEEEILATTIEAIQPLLESGKLHAVTLLEGGKFEYWNGDIPQQLSRIAEEWRTIGKPTIGDVVWFIGDRT